MSRPRPNIDLTKPHITDYTEHEFHKLIDGLYECWYDDNWTEEAEAMFERTIKHPDGLSLVYDGSHPYLIIEEIREWYKEQGLPFVQPDPVRPITDYTEKEFLAILVAMEDVANLTEEEELDLICLYKDTIKHPKAWALIRNEKPGDGSPEAVIAEIKRWYKEQGKPCFKPE